MDILNKEKATKMLADLESEQIERTTSISDTSKFAQAVCAFSNNLSNSPFLAYREITLFDSLLLFLSPFSIKKEKGPTSPLYFF